MEFSKVFSPALAIPIYFLLVASAHANLRQVALHSARSREPSTGPSPTGPYSLQSWAHEPMFVDEPRWILLSSRGRGQSSSEEADDDRFWVTRGKKRYLHSPRPPTLPDRRVSFVVEDDERDSWTGRGKKGTLSNVLENDPFWVNRGKRADVSSALDQDPFWVNRGKRDVKDKKNSVGQMLNQDPYWANRGKKGDVSSTLGNGEQFWVNRGKKGDLESMLDSGDKFWVNRGKKSDLQDALANGDQFWVNRGKKNEIQSALGEQFWVNRGKKSELQSALGDQFWVNRGKKSELQSALGDQFWVNRGKKNELQSMLDGGDQFWVNRGKKNEIQSLLNGGDQFWVNRGKKSELESLLEGGDQFWVNRGKKSDLQSMLDGGDQFWVNRGKKSELQSALGDQFWVNRGKKNDIQSLLNNGDQFWVNRGKKSDLQSMLEGGDQFWVNRGKKSELQSALGDQFWVNRGKKSDIQSMLDGGEQFWVNRGKKNELQSALEGGDQFWVNRGKKLVTGNKGSQINRILSNSDVNGEDLSDVTKASHDNSELLKKYFSPGGSFFWPDPVWNDRFKKDPLKTILKPDAFFVNRGKKAEPKPEGNTNETQSREERTKRQLPWESERDDKPLTTLFQDAYWLDRGKKTNDGPESLDPFWVTRGKRFHNRKRREVEAEAEKTTKPPLEQTKSTVAPLHGSSRHKRTPKSPVTNHLKKSDVNSLLLWWKSKPALSDFDDSNEDLRIGSPVMVDNIPKQEPFWVNRGKKDDGFEEDRSDEDMVLEKRSPAAAGEDEDVATELGALSGDTFWVARG